ncbi:ABC transporter ATP-binding protein [Nitratireductor soli]|uniref:ABC transporter ATP-binding protein n=1 Tax=Nitratireductor soli TaxID=1670619 RepID=UPI00065E688D|nr:dipeptide ABC transporter ATP-binding protein [Nitratireductor soli]
MSTALLEVSGLKKHYALDGGLFRKPTRTLAAVDGVSFTISSGETLGLVGESGCGKSTTAKMIVRLTETTEGSIRICGEDISTLGAGAMRHKRRDVQIIFQDPYSSLNPRMRAGDIVAEPLRNFGIGREEVRTRVASLFDRVGLRSDYVARFPHEFSGGQRQRLGIARALALEPKLIVCDEPVSALDVSVQAQVINLLTDLQRELGIAYLFVAHDLAVVEHISHRVAVMYLGRIVEMADRQTLFSDPRHPYTQALLAAAPSSHPRQKKERLLLCGDAPSPTSPPSGCPFRTRCPIAEPGCAEAVPALRDLGEGRQVACHLR